ncbi:hypothetical protein HZA42_01010 [Candidatus Peregrinibacteria bacterium]|nr:hypothetical protein [Candidatus Peregrinibacteria bacterium]
MAEQFVKIVVFVPTSHADKVRRALADAGCGKIGNYDSCCFSVRGVGQFRALKGAKPFIGKIDKVEKIAEERIETICPKKDLKKALAAVKEVHPYEEPAIDAYPLL